VPREQWEVLIAEIGLTVHHRRRVAVLRIVWQGGATE
jgi:hypothetical protein